MEEIGVLLASPMLKSNEGNQRCITISVHKGGLHHLWMSWIKKA